MFRVCKKKVWISSGVLLFLIHSLPLKRKVQTSLTKRKESPTHSFLHNPPLLSILSSFQFWFEIWFDPSIIVSFKKKKNQFRFLNLRCVYIICKLLLNPWIWQQQLSLRLLLRFEALLLILQILSRGKRPSFHVKIRFFFVPKCKLLKFLYEFVLRKLIYMILSV